MKKSNKKGFTIVELVIVIAVIGILAAVLIPTFGGIIDNANKTAAMQEANNIYKDALATDLIDGDIDNTTVSKDGYTLTLDASGNLTAAENDKYTFTVSNNAITGATAK